MFTKPNEKTIMSSAIQGGALVIGAKLGDGVSAIMPASTNSYKRWILGAAGLIAAACVSPATVAGKAAQAALVGMGGKQLYDEVTERAQMSGIVADAKEGDVPSITQKFLSASVNGNNASGAGYPNYNLGEPWEAAPAYSPQPQIVASNFA